MPETNKTTDEKVDLVTQAEELVSKQLRRGLTSADVHLSGNATLLIAATYALQVARGDENINLPQVAAEPKTQPFRVAGIGIVHS
jgi:hypothetical protein